MDIIIDGGPLWDVQQSPDEAARMAKYVARAGPAPQRCGTCAFRPGTEANASALVLELVEDCLLMDRTFGCHHGGKHPAPPCAGYVALAESFPKSE